MYWGSISASTTLKRCVESKGFTKIGNMIVELGKLAKYTCFFKITNKWPSAPNVLLFVFHMLPSLWRKWALAAQLVSWLVSRGISEYLGPNYPLNLPLSLNEIIATHRSWVSHWVPLTLITPHYLLTALPLLLLSFTHTYRKKRLMLTGSWAHRDLCKHIWRQRKMQLLQAQK